jgi:glycosyltransferase involved in cell wall biosynthesis
VVIPVHNRPVAVRRAIDSVRAQTRQDFEIIVVDDGSTDDTVAAVEAIGDPRINVGQTSTKSRRQFGKELGIHAGLARYVAFLDSDDEWFPTKLEKMLMAFEALRARSRIRIHRCRTRICRRQCRSKNSDRPSGSPPCAANR